MSAAWDRKHEDPTHTGQKWYCKVCNSKYMTRYGFLNELVIHGKSYWVRMHWPEQNVDLLKMKASMIETMMQMRGLKPQTAQELFQTSVAVPPTECDFLRPARTWVKTGKEWGKWGNPIPNTWSVDPAAFEGTTPMTIFDIINGFKKSVQEGKPEETKWDEPLVDKDELIEC